VTTASALPARRAAHLTGDRRTTVSWAALLVAAVLTILPALTNDVRDRLMHNGDQVTYLMQALSIANDSHTPNFDRRDGERWREIVASDDPAETERWSAQGWGQEPYGLFFQRYDGGWALAKPYGYSLYLAVMITVFGFATGIAIGNVLLLVALIGISIWLARMRWSGPAVPLIVGALYLASYAYLYVYGGYTDLFLALITLIATGAAFRYATGGRLGWALVSAAAMGFGVTEKSAFLVLFLPLALVMMWKARRPAQVLAIAGVGLLTVAVAVLPYLRYSDWTTISPYSGERYQVSSEPPATPPWEGGANYAGASFANESSLDRLGQGGPLNMAESLAYTFVGQHTGILVFMPVAFLILLVVLARIRRLDAWAIALLCGILGYLVAHVMLFPNNYYGGGQSFGNRYFLQVAPAMLVLALFARLESRRVAQLGLAGIALGVVFLLPNHLEPDRALYELWHTSVPQRLMPYEANQDYAPVTFGPFD
jgi:hypothetical protein